MAQQPFINFKLAGIYTDNFIIHTIPEMTEGADLQHRLSINIGWADEVKHLVVSTESQIIYQEKTVVEIAISCEFAFDDPATFFFDDKIVIPSGIIHHLAAVTFSTARGVLHARTESTPLQSFYLPLTNVREMFPDDVELPAPKSRQ